MLLCRTPRDWISIKEYKKSTYRGTIIEVTSPVCIRETMQCLRSVYRRPYTEGCCSIKITKQAFDHYLMVFECRMHKLGEFVHDKGNIRLSHPEMLEATNHPSINEEPMVSDVKRVLELSMLCLLRRSMTCFC